MFGRCLKTRFVSRLAPHENEFATSICSDAVCEGSLPRTSAPLRHYPLKHGQDLLYLLGELSRLANRLRTQLTAINTRVGGHEFCLWVCLIVVFLYFIQIVSERVGLIPHRCKQGSGPVCQENIRAHVGMGHACM